MLVDSCVAMPAASSVWTILRQRNCEDRSGMCVLLARQGHHVQQSAGTDGRGSRRPVDTIVDTGQTVRRQVVKSVDYRHHAQFKFHTLSDILFTARRRLLHFGLIDVISGWVSKTLKLRKKNSVLQRQTSTMSYAAVAIFFVGSIYASVIEILLSTKLFNTTHSRPVY